MYFGFLVFLPEVFFWFYLLIIVLPPFFRLFVDILEDSVLDFLLLIHVLWKCIQSNGWTLISLGMTSNSRLWILIETVMPQYYLFSEYPVLTDIFYYLKFNIISILSYHFWIEPFFLCGFFKKSIILFPNLKLEGTSFSLLFSHF